MMIEGGQRCNRVVSAMWIERPVESLGVIVVAAHIWVFNLIYINLGTL